MAKRKDDRMEMRVNADLKARFFAACDYKHTDPTEVLTRTMVAYTREAEKDAREAGTPILPAKSDGSFIG